MNSLMRDLEARINTARLKQVLVRVKLQKIVDAQKG